MGSQACYACCRKKMLGWIREKMVILESTPEGDRFCAFGSTIVGNGASSCNDLCTLGEDCSFAIGNDSWDNAHTFNLFSRVRSWAKS
jgi:hypothetical protein